MRQPRRAALFIAISAVAWAAALAVQAAPLVYYTFSPPAGSKGPNETYGGAIPYGTVIGWAYLNPLFPHAFLGEFSAPAQLIINNPNSYGGNYRYFQNPSGGAFASVANWSNGGRYQEFAEGVPGESGQLITTAIGGPIGPIYAPLPGAKDTAVFGPGPSAATITLGSQTVAQTQAMGFSSSPLSPITFNLGGAYTSTYAASLEAQSIKITGSGSFSTAYLTVAGATTVSSGTLSGDTTIIDNDEANLTKLYGQNYPISTTLTVSGGQSIFNAKSYVVIGQNDDGPATLLVQNGAKANLGAIYLGQNGGANGSLVINNAAVKSNSFVVVGYSGIGDLLIKGGGSLTQTGSSAGFIGAYDGSTGTATVTGAKSNWTIGGNLDVGFGGSGGVTLDQSGAMHVMGYLVEGDGSAAKVSVTNAATLKADQGLFVGNIAGGSSQLTIGSGGVVTSAIAGGSSNFAGVVGGGSGANGAVTIDGSGSLWDVKQSLSIGAHGTGSVSVSGGATLQVEGSDLYLGHDQGGTGTLVLTGAQTTLKAQGVALHVARPGPARSTSRAARPSTRAARIWCSASNPPVTGPSS